MPKIAIEVDAEVLADFASLEDRLSRAMREEHWKASPRNKQA